VTLKDSLIQIPTNINEAGIAQLGERQTEDLKVACSIHAHRNRLYILTALIMSLHDMPLI